MSKSSSFNYGVPISAFLFSCLAGSVQAQSSSVTVYGRMDASALHIGGPNSKSAVDEGIGATSHLGFRGTEDLGGGLSALFNLEAKVGLDTGAAGAAVNSGAFRTSAVGFFSRSAYVGLRGSAGTVTLGRNYTSAIRALYNLNAIPVGINTGLGSNVAPQGIGNDFWNSNEIKYDSPVFGGFSAMVNYSPGEVDGNSSRGRNLGGAIFYRSSGLVLTAGHQKDQDVTTANSLNWSVVTAAYTVGALKLTAGYDRVKNSQRIAGWTDSRLWTLGGAYTVRPALTFALQYFNNRDTRTGTTSSQWVVNGLYSLSKRTALYVTATRTNNRAIAIMPLYNNAGTPYTQANALALGVQHSF
jgi:GBP family porin